MTIKTCGEKRFGNKEFGSEVVNGVSRLSDVFGGYFGIEGDFESFMGSFLKSNFFRPGNFD